MSFETIVGNDKIKSFLKQAIKENHILHSYLFVGIDGIGKSIFAKEFARNILCIENEETEDCISCLKWKSQNHPDFYQIEPENETIKIEQIRSMQEKISEKPITSKRKIYIIIDSDTMTKEAQNCLLKTLEEPPEYATIILTAANESKLLNTIKSRCMKVPFEGIEEEKIEKYLKEIGYTNPSKELIKKSGESIGRAIRLQMQSNLYEQINKFLDKIENKDFITISNEAEVLYKEKENIQEILEYIIICLYQTKERKKIEVIQYVEETKKRLLANSNYDMCIDYLIMKLWEVVAKK